jgi:hypothetical protein
MGPVDTDRDRSPRGASLISGTALALLVGAVYLLFPARLYFGEGFKWALSEPAVTGGLFRFFHPHHLLYNPLGYLVHQLLSLLRPGLSPMISFRLLDTLAGLGGVLVFHRMICALWRRNLTAVLSSAGFAFSWGYWSHCVNVEVYSVSVFFLVLGFSIALRAVRNPASGPGLWGLFGLVAGVSVLFHQSNVLFLTVPLAAALQHPGGWRHGMGLLWRFFVPAYVAVTILPYLAVMLHLGFRAPGPALTWLFLYSHQAETYLGTGPSVVIHAVISFGRMLLLPASYTTVTAVPLVPPQVLLALKWASALLLGLLLVPTVFHWRQFARSRGPGLVLAAALTVPYALFFTFWDPGGYFFWLPLGIPFWLVIAGAAASLPWGRRPHAGAGVLGLAVLALFTVNFVGGVLPESRLSRVDDHQLLQLVAGQMGEGDLLLLNSPRMEVLSNFGGPLFYGYARAFGSCEVQCLYPGLEIPEQEARLRDLALSCRRTGRGLWYLDEVLGGRSTRGGREGVIREAFHRWGMRSVLAAAHSAGDVYNGSILYRLVPDPPEDEP